MIQHPGLFQSILGGEGLSLQIRHICSYLIWYCSHHLSTSDLLNEVILLIGNFVVLNTDNQVGAWFRAVSALTDLSLSLSVQTLLQSGQRPTVVQQLCSLPFEYFSDDRLQHVLFPTLIVCCFNNDDNMNILRGEMSTELLSGYIEQSMIAIQLQQLEVAERQQTIGKGERWNDNRLTTDVISTTSDREVGTGHSISQVQVERSQVLLRRETILTAVC